MNNGSPPFPLISTHAPHARRDDIAAEVARKELDFYSRASCEARHYYSLLAQMLIPFLLTRLMRGATEADLREADLWDFYSRASCEARQLFFCPALRNQHFYSRASCEARLSPFSYRSMLPCISTHAPHARRDRNI